jgi:alpha-tubulin suppressor-like RCC1 family protein
MRMKAMAGLCIAMAAFACESTDKPRNTPAVVAARDVRDGDGGSAVSSASECASAEACPSLATEPPDCAVAECTAGHCGYRTRDADGDGFRDLYCRIVSGDATIETGNDCDDGDADVHPQAWDGPAGSLPDGTDAPGSCNQKDDDCDGLIDNSLTDQASCMCTDGETQRCRTSADGTPIHYPTELPLGECALGTQRCEGTTWSLCDGARGPSAELCDGLDNDCNGLVDDNADDEQLFYCDEDGDGHLAPGTPAVPTCPANIAGCKGLWQPYAAEELFDDCDDEDPNAFEGNAETCDGHDNDCDGLTDEVKDPDGELRDLHTRYFDDNDGDGYGDDATAKLLCGKAGGVEQGGDCDDQDADVHPKAAEICNGKDDDCNSKTDETAPGAHLLDEPSSEGTRFACIQGAWGVTGCPGTQLDCNRIAGDACETDGATIENCHDCARSCGFACAASGCDEVASIAAGGVHTSAITKNGRAVGWGDNQYGQVGNGTPSPQFEPVALDLQSPVSAVAAGGDHSCAIAGPSKGLFCWGFNGSQQLGAFTGVLNYSAAPLPVDRAPDEDPELLTLVDVRMVATGKAHTCAIYGDGILVCWGSNGFGQIGMGVVDPDMPQASPSECYNDTQDDIIKDAVEVAAGGNHTCIVTADHGVDCWGDNSSGQVGGDDVGPVPSARRVDGLAGVDHIAAGDEFTCALKAGDVFCWGNNGSGQLGTGSVAATSGVAVKVAGLPRIRSISLGAYHACAVDESGGIFLF